MLTYLNSLKLKHKFDYFFKRINILMKNKMFNLSLGLILFVSIGLSLGEDVSLNWALLVAGSNEYYNYRHQV